MEDLSLCTVIQPEWDAENLNIQFWVKWFVFVGNKYHNSSSLLSFLFSSVIHKHCILYMLLR